MFKNSSYPHRDLPIFPSILLPLVKGERVVLELSGVPDPNAAPPGLEFFEDLASAKISDIPENLRHAYLMEVVNVSRKIFSSKRLRPYLNTLSVAIPDSINLRDLSIPARSMGRLQWKPFFSANGPWRFASVGDLVDKLKNPGVGYTTILAFLIASESLENSLVKDIPQGGFSKFFPTCAEDEIQKVLTGCIHNQKYLKIFSKLNGWGGYEKECASSIAKEYKVSAKRISQISIDCAGAVFGKAYNKKDSKYLSKCFSLIRDASPIAAGDATTMLLSQGLIKSRITSEALLRAGVALGIDSGVACWNWDSQKFVSRTRNHSPSNDVIVIMSTDQAKLMASIKRLATKELSKDGIVNKKALVDVICRKLFVSPRMVNLALTLRPDFSPADEYENWILFNKESDRMSSVRSLIGANGSMDVRVAFDFFKQGLFIDSVPPIATFAKALHLRDDVSINWETGVVTAIYLADCEEEDNSNESEFFDVNANSPQRISEVNSVNFIEKMNSSLISSMDSGGDFLDFAESVRVRDEKK